MKKTLLAAALLAGFATAGVAQAETSVTLYGILDTGYGYSRYKLDNNDVNFRATRSGLTSGIVNGNRFGLKGSEDLGDGLRAVFQLEQGFDIGNGQPSTTRQFHRQAYVGLASDSWGSFTMGRQYSAGVMVGDLASNGWSLGDMDKVFGGVGYANRIDNSFKYVTPDFAGFKAVALYGTPKATIERDNLGDARDDRTNRVSAGLLYANGPIAAGASYDRESSVTAFVPANPAAGTAAVPAGRNEAITNWNVNASYDFEVVKLALAYGRDRHGKLGWAGSAAGLTGIADDDLHGGVGYEDFRSNNYHVALSAPLGGGTAYAAWNRSSSNLDNEDAWGDAAGNINAYQLSYFYPLSKRTGVYAYGSYVKNVGYVRDLKGTEAGIGLNHKF